MKGPKDSIVKGEVVIIDEAAEYEAEGHDYGGEG